MTFFSLKKIQPNILIAYGVLIIYIKNIDNHLYTKLYGILNFVYQCNFPKRNH